MKAIKDILTGEEITVQYSVEYFGDNNEKCLCTLCSTVYNCEFSGNLYNIHIIVIYLISITFYFLFYTVVEDLMQLTVDGIADDVDNKNNDDDDKRKFF